MRAQGNQATSLAIARKPDHASWQKGRTKDKRIPQPVAVLPATNRAARLTQLLYAHPFFLMDALQFPMHTLKRPLSRIQQPSRLH